MRVVLFSVSPWMYRLVVRWARAHDHEVTLLVTTSNAVLPASTAPEQDVLVTNRLPIAARMLAGLEPDLLLVATYPRRVPDELLALPRLGAVNLHPTALPTGRGPNPARGIYVGEPMMGATVHWMTARLDAGAVLARVQAPVPAIPTVQRLRAVWTRLLRQALDDGVSRASIGDPGEPQEELAATYAAPFTVAERWLDWNEPAATIQRRVAALSLGDPVALARLETEPVRVLRAHAGVATENSSPPGLVLRQVRPPGEPPGKAIVQAADAAVTITYQPLAAADFEGG